MVMYPGAALQGGIEHTVCSCMVVISLCVVVCPGCRDVEHALKAVRNRSRRRPARFVKVGSRLACVRVLTCVVVQYGAFCVMGCCASVVQVVGTALLVSKSDGIEQLAISIKEADGGGLGQQ